MALFFDEYIPVSFVTDIENLVSAIPCVGQRSDFGIVGNDNLGIVGIRGRNGSAGYHVFWSGNVVHRSKDWCALGKDIKFSAIMHHKSQENTMLNYGSFTCQNKLS